MTGPAFPDRCNVMAILIVGMGVMNCLHFVHQVTPTMMMLAMLTFGVGNNAGGVGACDKMWCVYCPCSMLTCVPGDKTCPVSQFRCYDGSCLPNYYRCNGRYDCPAGEDELNCSMLPCFSCLSWGLKCVLACGMGSFVQIVQKMVWVCKKKAKLFWCWTVFWVGINQNGVCVHVCVSICACEQFVYILCT